MYSLKLRDRRTDEIVFETSYKHSREKIEKLKGICETFLDKEKIEVIIEGEEDENKS